MQGFKEVMEYLKKNYPHRKGQNYIRFCGVVDIYRGKKGKVSVFIIPEKSWYYPKNKAQLEDCAINILDIYLERWAEENNGRRGEGFILPFGMHKGLNVHKAPADYLIWLYDNDKTSGQLHRYIEQNEVILRHQAKKASL